MTDIDTLIRDLEDPLKEHGRDTWIRVVRFAYDQGWHDDEGRDLNEYLVGKAFDFGEENILIAVALTLVPVGDERWYMWKVTETSYHAEIGTQDITTDYPTPALALGIAALKTRRDP